MHSKGFIYNTQSCYSQYFSSNDYNTTQIMTLELAEYKLSQCSLTMACTSYKYTLPYIVNVWELISSVHTEQ
jgi:hypothetical protein